MSTKPSPPWTLRCPFCEWKAVVSARGNDPGSGVAAAQYLAAHAKNVHGKTWAETVGLARVPPLILCARVSWPVPATRYGNLWRCSWCGARVKVVA